MEKRNQVALTSLISELDNLSKRNQLDDLGDEVIESSHIKRALDILKPNISDNAFRALKEDFRRAGDEAARAAADDSVGSSPPSPKQSQLDVEEAVENLLEKSIPDLEPTEPKRRRRGKRQKTEEHYKSIDVKTYLEIIEEAVANVVTEDEVMLALKTLTEFKQDAISVSEMRYLLTAYGNVSTGEVDEIVLMATGAKKLSQVDAQDQIDFRFFVDKLFAIA